MYDPDSIFFGFLAMTEGKVILNEATKLDVTTKLKNEKQLERKLYRGSSIYVASISVISVLRRCMLDTSPRYTSLYNSELRHFVRPRYTSKYNSDLRRFLKSDAVIF